MNDKNYETINQRQSYVQKSGKEWENFVKNYVNQALRTLGSSVKVIKGDSIPKGTPLWKKLAIPVGKPGSTTKIWGDVDLVALDQNKKPIAVISCKTSLHGRFSETLFYAEVLRDLVVGLKIVFATLDKGRQQKGGKWQSEWGSEERPTKDRLLGSHYLDGVYVKNERTKLGGMLKSLVELAYDLNQWSKNRF